jgi:HD-GYP domain-containing protein (c-di-GMP phosphodiesterase class II)
MAEDNGTTGVPVELLRPGLYVRELDRPWVETPFLFQGFRIVGAEELEALREYCRIVIIDDERSDAKALEAVRREVVKQGHALAAGESAPAEAQPAKATRPTPKRPSERARRRSVGVLFADSENPDRKRFSTLVRAASAARGDAQAAASDALARARDGRMVDIARIESTVDELTDLVIEDPTASLWLTRMRERDEGMAVHAVNTTVLALTIGAHLGIDRRGLRRLALGALLHDVGKTTVPSDLLEKPDELSDQELARVREYPQAGYELVADSGHVHTESLEVIRLHRERWDGCGYPRGLRGEMIPRKALIVGLADAYDTMTSRRPWAEAVAPDKALHELYANAAQEFSVDLVQEFIRCMGIFPVGSVVELDNGARGIVVGARPGGGLWPTILMVRTPDGDPYRKRLLLNLGAEVRRRDDGPRRIARSIDASASGIDVSRLVAREFGLAA